MTQETFNTEERQPSSWILWWEGLHGGTHGDLGSPRWSVRGCNLRTEKCLELLPKLGIKECIGVSIGVMNMSYHPQP